MDDDDKGVVLLLWLFINSLGLNGSFMHQPTGSVLVHLMDFGPKSSPESMSIYNQLDH